MIAATGFQCPLRDLTDLGVTVFGQSRLPAMTNFYESANVPGIFFAGTIGQGVAGSRSTASRPTPVPSMAPATTRGLMVEHVAEARFGTARLGRRSSPRTPSTTCSTEATTAPELWNQKSYLARAISRVDGAIVDEGIVSLADFVDSAGPDAVAITVETDDTGDIHPEVYVREEGKPAVETLLSSQPMHDFRTTEHHAQLASLLAGVTGGAVR